jgi:hypothetical protein
MASDPKGFEAFFMIPAGFGGRSRPADGIDVTRVTPLSHQAFIVRKRNRRGRTMLLLSAILRIWLPRDPKPNDLLAGIRLRVGHLGLTIIALVYILITFWQR